MLAEARLGLSASGQNACGAPKNTSGGVPRRQCPILPAHLVALVYRRRLFAVPVATPAICSLLLQ